MDYDPGRSDLEMESGTGPLQDAARAEVQGRCLVRASLKTAVSMGLLAAGVVAQNRQGRLPELPPKLYRWEELQHVARANVIAHIGWNADRWHRISPARTSPP